MRIYSIFNQQGLSMRNKNVKPETYTRRRQSMRLRGYDYAQPGMYFVTICVQNKLYLFGDIINNQMQCNDAGNMLWFWFYQIEHKFAGIKCDECIVMPNHIHFIVAIAEMQQQCHSIVAHDYKKTSLSSTVRRKISFSFMNWMAYDFIYANTTRITGGHASPPLRLVYKYSRRKRLRLHADDTFSTAP